MSKNKCNHKIPKGSKTCPLCEYSIKLQKINGSYNMGLLAAKNTSETMKGIVKDGCEMAIMIHQTKEYMNKKK